MRVRKPTTFEIEQFEKAWWQMKDRLCPTPCGGTCSLCLPERWVTSQILMLQQDCPDRPVEDLGPMIRSILIESRYTSASGDLEAASLPRPTIDRQISLILGTLDALKTFPTGRETLPAPAQA